MLTKLRVLAVTNTFPTEKLPGDTPCIRDHIFALRAQGVDVDLWHIDRSNKLNYAKAAWKLFLLSFRRKRYDLIHAFYGHCGLLSRLQFRYPVVVTFRGSDLLSRRDGAIGRIVVRLVDEIIVMSEEMKRAAKRNDAHIIPFGVNLNLFTPYPMARARRELGLPLKERLILFPWDPARSEKRFDIVKEAIHALKKEHKRIGLVVVFDKPHEILARYMNACDAMVLASDREGAPVAIREAIACNLPIVSVDVGDVRQVIGDAEGCYLCRREPQDIAERLSWILKRKKRTKKAATNTPLDAASSAQQVISVYNLVLNRSLSHF